MKKTDLDLELGRRYKFDKLFRKHGNLLLVKAEEVFIFRSDIDVFFYYSKKELKDLKFKVVELDNNFDLIWFLMERVNLDQNLMPGYWQAKAMYNYMSPIIRDSAKALKYYAGNINPSMCCKAAEKDCGDRARKVVQKHNL